MLTEIRIGDPVSASAAYARSFRRDAFDRRTHGKVTSLGFNCASPNCIRVKWDNIKHPETLHIEFVDPIPDVKN